MIMEHQTDGSIAPVSWDWTMALLSAVAWALMLFALWDI
jgi:hypothetical protein